MPDTAFDVHEQRSRAGQAAAYGRSFGRLCSGTVRQLLTAAAVRQGQHVLDVGTGTGSAAAAACALGAGVTALDRDPDMLECAVRAAPTATCVRAELPRLPFARAAFDAAVDNFVVNHVGRPAAAIAELRRVTRPGGRIAVTSWPGQPPPAQQLLNQALDAAGAVRPADLPRLDPEDDFARTREGLAALLTSAGLTGVCCETLQWEQVIDFDDWWSGPAAGISVPGQVLAGQTDDVARRARRAFAKLSSESGLRRADGLLVLSQTALLAQGTA